LFKRLEAARVGKLWDLVQRLTGQGASPHGFRASFRSWCRARKIRDDVAERALAHGRGRDPRSK
jgi:integrase